MAVKPQVVGTTKTGHDIWSGLGSPLAEVGVKPALTQFQSIGGDLHESNGAGWNIISSGGAPSMHIASSAFTREPEVVEQILAGTAAAATVTGSTWIPMSNVIGGMIFFGVTGANLATGNLVAYYSNDGLNVDHTETLKALTGGASESHSIHFGETVAGADAAGFTPKIKTGFNFMKTGLASGTGTFVSTTLKSFINLVRQNG